MKLKARKHVDWEAAGIPSGPLESNLVRPECSSFAVGTQGAHPFTISSHRLDLPMLPIQQRTLCIVRLEAKAGASH